MVWSSPGAQHDTDLALELLETVRGGDGEQVHVVAGEGAAEQPLGAELWALGVGLDVEEVLGEVGVAVGVAVRQVHRVPAVGEGQGEGEGVGGAILLVLGLSVVLVIPDNE